MWQSTGQASGGVEGGKEGKKKALLCPSANSSAEDGPRLLACCCWLALKWTHSHGSSGQQRSGECGDKRLREQMSEFLSPS